jgi:hypothetical protein
MISSMRPVEALQHRASRFRIAFDGGHGADGNVEMRSWLPATGSSKTFSISRSGLREEFQPKAKPAEKVTGEQ